MKRNLSVLSLLFLCLFLRSYEVFAQCQPYIKIDGNRTLANQTVAAGVALPSWLKAGQTLAAGQMVNSVSVIEFAVVNGNTLQFSQVLAVTSVATVPVNTVWKIESINKQPALSSSYGAIYNSPGTYNFTVPSCAEYICIEVWGGGGGGGGGDGSGGFGGGGGGGGAYGQQCFTVTPGSSITVTVGSGGPLGGSTVNGGTGGTTSVGALISATGGTGGNGATSSGNGAGQPGGSSTGTVNVSGGSGSNGGLGSVRYGGTGGSSGGSPNSSGGTGGIGGIGSSGVPGSAGVAPGGGGGGGSYGAAGANGAAGKVIITW